MDIKQLQDSRNQHLVAIEKDGELRCFFQWHDLHTASLAYRNLLRDIANHGDSVVNFQSLPVISTRTAKSGKTIYEVAPDKR